MQILNNLAIY